MRTGQDWAETEFSSAVLGDARRTKRLVALAAALAESPAGKVTEVVEEAAQREGAYRFVENAAIEPSAIAAAHHGASARRCRSSKEVIVPIDQTSLTITDRVGKPGFGQAGPRPSPRKRGLQAMSALAVSEDGVTQGLVGQHWWSRREKSPPWSKDKRPPEQRESILWQRTLLQSHEVLQRESPDTIAWYQLDRGADSGAVLRLVVEHGLKATIRSAYDRRTAKAGALRKSILRRPVAGHIELEVLPDDRKALRRARLAVRFGSVELSLSDLQGRRSGTVRVNCVHVREARSPRGRTRLQWWLLTTAPVSGFDSALEVVEAYRTRWRIEELHRAWKSGVCNIEQSQLRSAAALQRWASISVAVAARSERLKTLSRSDPDADAETALSRSEIDAVIILTKRTGFELGDRLTLGQAVDLIARLGGYIGKSSGGPPGVRVIQRGLDRILGAAQAIEILRKSD